MAVAFASIAATNLTTKALSVQAPCPTGTQPGDLLLVIGQNIASYTYDTPSGCSVLAMPNDDGSVDVGSSVFYRFADATDIPGSTTYTLHEDSGTSTAQVNVGVTVRYTGVDPNQFPLAWNASSNNPSARVGLKHNTTTTSGGSQCPAPTNPTGTVGPNDLVVRIYLSGCDTKNQAITFSGSPPTNWTQRGSYITSASSSLYAQGMLVLDRTGAVDSATISNNRVSMWDIYTIVLPGVAGSANQFMPFFGM